MPLLTLRGVYHVVSCKDCDFELVVDNPRVGEQFRMAQNERTCHMFSTASAEGFHRVEIDMIGQDETGAEIRQTVSFELDDDCDNGIDADFVL